MSEPSIEEYAGAKRIDSVNEYTQIVVKDLNDLAKQHKIKYRTNTELYKGNYVIKVIIDESQSSVIKPRDTAMAITPNVTEETLKILWWKRKRHRIHLTITLYMDKIPGIRIEAIRALFKLYTDKLVYNLRLHELKDADSKIDLIFI